MNTGKTFEIRPARAEDLAPVRELLAQGLLPHEGLEEQFGPSYVVAQSDGKVVGVVGVERYGPFGLLRSAATENSWRGRGVGQSLTRERIGWSRDQRLKALYLLTTTAADFFARFGFREVERPAVPEEIRGSREFAVACPESAVVMTLPLGDDRPA